MDTPLVSVIIPVYNVEPYLRQCLESVVNQSYKNLEILIIDDGSTDGCSNICDEYLQDYRAKVFHTANKGLPSARNLGLDNAKGIYVAFLDSDDWLELNSIEKCVRTTIADNADIVCFRCLREYKNVSREEGAIYPEKKIFDGDKILKEYCTGQMIWGATWNKLYKRSIFSDVRFPEDRFFEDIATSHLFLQRAKRVV